MRTCKVGSLLFIQVSSCSSFFSSFSTFVLNIIVDSALVEHDGTYMLRRGDMN